MKDWKNETIPSMLAEAVSRWGKRTAIITEEGEKLTFHELYDTVCNLAMGLDSIGVKKGDHVGTLMGGRATYIVTSYALMMIGAVVVPINYNFQPEEMDFVLNQSDSQYLIMEDDITNLNPMEKIKQISPEIDGQDGSDLSLKKLPNLRKIIVSSLWGRKYPGTYDFHEVLQEGSRRGISLGERFLSERKGGDLGFILYTSGTTSFPKGAMRTQGSCLGIAYYITVAPFRLTERDVVLAFSPFFHIGGCVYTLFGPHICGSTIILMKSFDPGRALELIEKYRVTLMGGFETHFHRLLKHPRFPSTDVSSVTKIRLATGPYWYDKVRGNGLGREAIAHHYGFTEGTGVVMPDEETDEDIRRNANGRPFPGVELKIVEPETGKRLPVGTPGEICLKGWTLFQGYYKMPELTRDSIDGEGYFHTGDYGWLDARGYLYYRGRYKQMVKTGGENVSQREVEVFLEGHPDIQAVQVIGLPDEEWGELVTAVVQTQSGQALSLEQVKQYGRGKLAGFKIPKRVLIIQEQEWPVTRVGKVDKIQLRRWAMEKLGINSTFLLALSFVFY